ncbi:hypothetical protein [Litorilituus lipolyticus]|uniref:Uncharacterized protein n=1 Tax=Litorilituus lipolyticus TaxID=2491017 RepID=A0A502KNR8_9GAMM|nr:hypothetical protein [Litorilituus lipolyticus]TPH13258.1 hypothetical protein EPA86_13775 [Litorilituus lipolyticus]
MTTQVITTRFPRKDAEDLKYYAELNNLTTAEMVRLACKTYTATEQQKIVLQQLQNNITKNVFIMLNATINLTNEDRKDAARAINLELDGVTVK